MRFRFRHFSSLLLVVCLSVTSSACERPKCPVKYLIPKGYVGWARVLFNVKGTPALPRENGILIVRFQSAKALQLETSSSEFTECGGGKTEFFYYDENNKTYFIPNDFDSRMGDGNMIHNLANGGYERDEATPRQQYEQFFVGTAEQFEKRDKSKDSFENDPVN